MAGRTIKKLVGILNDVLVRIMFFIFPTKFIILEGELNFKTIILGRSIIMVKRALVAMEIR